MITPLRNAQLQSNLDCNGFAIIGGGVTGRVFDVKVYGATGDGTTDDTAAIQDALAAIPSEGGVLYFPAGIYKYTGATLTLNKQITVEGDGGEVRVIQGGIAVAGFRGLSTIDFNSTTVPLFTVTANGCMFRDITMRNISVTEPTAGAGILVSSGGDRTRYQNVTVHGFYIGIDVQNGMAQNWQGCYISAPVLYGIKLRHIAVPDGGDHCISDCLIYGGLERPFTSGIRIESGGGPKIVNTKINSMTNALMVNGIDLAVGDNVVTSDLLVANCSIESFTGAGIKGTTSATNSKWGNIYITGNQFLALSGSAYGIHFAATTADDFYGVVINGNYGRVNGSSNPFIRLANCTDAILSANGHGGFNSLATFGSGVTHARSQVVPPGGTTGQSLKKVSNTDYDIGWA